MSSAEWKFYTRVSKLLMVFASPLFCKKRTVFLFPSRFQFSILKKKLCISFFPVEFSFPISITINAIIANNTTLSTDMTTMVSLLLHNMTAQNQTRIILLLFRESWKMTLEKVNGASYNESLEIHMTFILFFSS